MILLDTNIVIKHIRKELIYAGSSFISIITVGEIKAFAKKRNWGENKLQLLKKNLDVLSVIDISHHITDVYVEIDAFSQGLHPVLPVIWAKMIFGLLQQPTFLIFPFKLPTMISAI